jgi:structural maintenance of chromosome 1
VDKQLKGKQDEVTALDKLIAQIGPRANSAQKELDEATRQTTALRRTVEAEDDAVFATFCQRIQVKNIREYEERQHAQSEEKAEYEQHMKRLEHKKTFEERQLQADEERLDHNKKAIGIRTEQLTKYKDERRKLRSALDAIIADIDEMKEALNEMQKKDAKATEALRKARQQAQQAQTKLDANAKELAALHMNLELLATDRVKLYRRCRLEEINLPLQSGSKKLNFVPLEEDVSLTGSGDSDEDSMDVDGEESINVPDFGIKVDFTALSKEEKQDGSEEMGRDLEFKIEAAASELDKMTPNVRANDRLVDTENRLAEVDGEFEKARKEAKKAQDEYLRLKKLRCDLFNKAFDHISSKIDHVYKELTKSKISPKGGSAYLVLENVEEPYLGGLQFSAIPPAKTFRGIDHLSGGEKTMAAVALLFAVQSVFPAPFIVLDEVDAALDSVNVQRVADYIRSRASDQLQFIVISHKASLYERSSGLVGVMRNQHIKSSATLTLDLEQYA